jgi:hypothetical protein
VARREKKLKQIRTHVDVAASWLKEFRAVEMAEMAAVVARDRAWLQKVEPLILADPTIRSLYELLLSRIASAGAE